MSLADQTEPTLEEELGPELARDPFRLGWRFVERTRADGTVVTDQVPLTLDDLLFPQENDHPMQHPAHVEGSRSRGYLIEPSCRGG